ncbi:B12-binding domain-containing radical SAM protein [Chloroflexota bacterium]
MKQDQRKILLIEPPFYRLFKDTYSLDRYPLSLGYLAGTIRKETNWSVMAYNSEFYPQSETVKVSYLAGAGFDNYLKNLKELSGQLWREIKSTIAEYKPTVVGISAKSQTFASACIVAKLAKEINRQTVVIMGGPHPSMMGADLLNVKEIDIGVQGEGENTIVELLDAIENEKNFDSIQGIVFRKDGQVIENPSREYIKDLDSICFPHESAPEVLKDYEQYPLTAFRNIFATRGCPYNCSFCGSHKMWSRKVRFRSPENVIEEIKGLQKKGLRSIHFDDDTFGVTRQYIVDLCSALITHCPGLTWSCECNVKLVDEQTVSLMKAAGCRLIQIGIESGNNEILKKIGKNITIEQALSACKIIKKHGILLEPFFMVGFPQETEDTLNDTVVAMKKTKCDFLNYSIFTPYPGTEAFKFCKENGLIDDDYDVSLYYHQSPANCFCINITPERFRMLAYKIEKMVDRKNYLSNRKETIRRLFSLNTFWRIKELGIGESLKRGVRIFLGK